MKYFNGTLALILSLSLAQPADAFFGWGEKKAAPEPIGAVIVELSGKVEFQAKEGESWTAAQLQQPLEQGDMLMTDARGSVVILFTDGSKIRLSKNAAFVMEQQNEQEVKLDVRFGVFEAWVKKLRTRRWRVRTPSAVAAIRGTDFIIRLTSPDGSTMQFESLQSLIESGTPISVDTSFELYTGAMDVTDGFGNQAQLTPGQQLTASGSTGIAASKPKPLPPGKAMAKKPSSKDAAKKAAAEAAEKIKTAKKKLADAKKKAAEAKKKGDMAAAAKAEKELAAAKQEQTKADLVKKIAEEIVKMETLAEQPDPGTVTPPPGTTILPVTEEDGTTIKKPPADAQNEAVEAEEGIATDVSPSSP